MIETKDITKMVAHIIRRDRGMADPLIMHPTREWFVGLGITTLIVLLGSWFCWYIYTEYSQTINTAVSVTEPVVPYQAATIAEAITIYENKQIKYSEILGGEVITPVVTEMATSTNREELSTSTVDAPVVSTDPAPVLNEGGLPSAFLAP